MTDQMTIEALRRAIAEALGATVTTETRKVYTYHIVTWQDKRVGIALTASDAWRKAFESGAIPDWPGDPGAALALCLEIAREHSWGIRIEPLPDTERDDLLYVAFMAGTAMVHMIFACGKSEPFARLAHTVLKTQVVSA